MKSQENRNNARRDLIACIVVVVLLLAMSVFWDLSERWHQFSLAHESWELDELLVALGLSSLAVSWFSFRRWRQSLREVRARERANVELGREVAARRETERLLSESEGRLRQASKLAKVGYYIWDSVAERCLACSEEHAGMFGMSPSEFIDRAAQPDGLMSLIHPDDRDSYRVSRKTMREGLSLEMEYRALVPSGDYRNIREMAKLVYDAQGTLIQEICTCQDITELRRTEQQLRQTQKMEAIGQLTGGIAHDFNNLLAIIVGGAELLKDEVFDESGLLDDILKAATSGGELTRRLLAYSRQQPLTPRTIDAAELAVEAAQLLSRSLGEAYEIETRSEPGLWSATADPEQVKTALLNLILNGRDAMPDGGALVVASANAVVDSSHAAEHLDAQLGDYVVLSVTDAGRGMSKEEQDRAFEPFYTTKSFGAGSGLGLSMVYGFASQSGGHVSITSELGRGTTVRLFLPRATETVQRKPEEPAPTVQQGQGERILVLEDDRGVRELTLKTLEFMGYAATGVADVAAAHRAMKDQGGVDLVLSDVVLGPGGSGPDFARQALADHPNLKIVFMSGYPADITLHQDFLDLGTVLLQKPFHGPELAKTLREALDTA